MRRRQIPQPSSLITLVDVLFVLTFAALVQAAAARDKAAAAEDAAAEPTPPPAPAPDAGVAPVVAAELTALRARALADLAADLEGRPAVVARVSKDGVLTTLELADRRIELGVPLLERVPEPDIVVAYLGDRSADLRICRIAVLRLGVTDLSEHLIVISPDVPLADLTVALVAGLRRDAERCLAEQGGAAVVVDPAALTLAPESP